MEMTVYVEDRQLDCCGEPTGRDHNSLSPSQRWLIPVTEAQRYGGHNYRHQGKFIGYIAQIHTA